MLRARATLLEANYDDLAAQLRSANRECSELERTSLEAERNRDTAEGRVTDLESQIEYLKEQIKIYQTRLGLLPQERQGQSDGRKLEPLKRGRQPFAQVAARVQDEISARNEAYWKARAEAAAANITGKTTTQTDSEETE